MQETTSQSRAHSGNYWLQWCAATSAAIGSTVFGVFILGSPTEHWLTFSESPLAAFLIIAAICVMVHWVRSDVSYDRRTLICSCVFSLLYCTALVLYSNETYRGSANLGEPSTYVAIALLTPMTLFISCHLMKALQTPLSKPFKKSNARLIKIWIPILICWGAFLVVAWPGLYQYDGIFQTHWLVSDENINAHQPIIHSLWMSIPMLVSEKLVGSYYPGFAFYSISQVFLVSLVLALSIRKIGSWPIPQAFVPVATIFVCVFPGFATWASVATKDVAFAALFGLATVLLFDLLVFHSPKTQESAITLHNTKKTLIELWIVLLLVFLFRHNGIFAFVFLLIPLLLSEKQKRAIAAFALSLLASYALITGPLFGLLNPIPGGRTEAMSVPAVQLARVANMCNNLSTEDQEFIDTYVPDWPNYNESLSDPVKATFQIDAVSDNPLGFLFGYIRIGLEYPAVYTDAFLRLNTGFWSPITIRNNSPYSGLNVREPSDARPESDYLYIKPQSIIPAEAKDCVQSAMTERYELYIPGIASLFQTGTILWSIVFYVFICLAQRRERRWFYPAVFFFGYWLTLLFGPISLFRYANVAFACLPAFAGAILSMRRIEGNLAKQQFK